VEFPGGTNLDDKGVLLSVIDMESGQFCSLCNGIATELYGVAVVMKIMSS
jgi:hypothetical protein